MERSYGDGLEGGDCFEGDSKVVKVSDAGFDGVGFVRWRFGVLFEGVCGFR